MLRFAFYFDSDMWLTNVFTLSGFPAQHPGQLVVLWAAWRMDGRAGGRRGGGRTSAGRKEVTCTPLHLLMWSFQRWKTFFQSCRFDSWIRFCFPAGWFLVCPKKTLCCCATCWPCCTVSEATPRRTRWPVSIYRCASLPACFGLLERLEAPRWRGKELRR